MAIPPSIPICSKKYYTKKKAPYPKGYEAFAIQRMLLHTKVKATTPLLTIKL